MIPDPGAHEEGRDPQLEALYRAGSASQQPPARLDDAIRAAARRAVQAGPRRSADRFRRWSVPLSLAAVITLSVTVVTMMREEGGDRLDFGSADLQTLPPRPAAQPEAPSPGPADTVRQAPEERKQEIPPPAASAERRMEALQSSPPAAPAAPVERPQAAKKSAPLLAESRERDRPAATPPAEMAALGQSAAPAASALADSAAREDRAAPAAPAPQALRRSAPAAAMTDAGRAEESMAAKQASSTGASALAKTRGDALWQDLEQQPAGKWLERLRELRRDGRNEDFARLAAEFRRRFPDAALPDDLR